MDSDTRYLFILKVKKLSRLERGQVAVGVQQRQEACRRSTESRINVLSALLKGDGESVADLSHFMTLDALCEWFCPERGIERISPKTLRAHIEAIYPGGYRCFSMDVKKATNRNSTKNNLTIEKSTDLRADSVIEMVQRYFDLVDKMRYISKNNEPVRRALSEHFKKFGDYPNERAAKVIFASFGKSTEK